MNGLKKLTSNPNGLSYDEDTRALGVTDAMFFKIPISSFEQEQGD